MIPNVDSFISIIALGLDGVEILKLRWGWGCTLTVLKTIAFFKDGESKSYTAGAGQGQGAKGSTDFVLRWGRNLYSLSTAASQSATAGSRLYCSNLPGSDRSQLKSTKTKLKIQKDSNLSPDILGLFTTPAPSQLVPQLTSTGILARFRWDREFLRKLSF